MIQAIALTLVALLTLQSVRAQGEPQLPPAPGSSIDIGGRNLHLYCTGTGSPTVVMDAGLGDWSLSFRALQERVDDVTRVCTYDRAGFGWSDVDSEARTSERIVEDLHALLTAAEVEGPYVLVGHSFGGLNMILYAHEHPDLVAGVVLIDASHPDQQARLREEVPDLVALEEAGMASFRVMADAAEAGQVPAAAMLANAPVGVPEELRGTWAASFVRPTSLRAALAEHDALGESLAQVKENGSLGDVPLVVIAHGLKLGDTMPLEGRGDTLPSTESLERYEVIWRSLQEDHLSRSSDSELIVAANGAHYVHDSEPDLVVDAIRRLVDRER